MGEIPPFGRAVILMSVIEHLLPIQMENITQDVAVSISTNMQPQKN